MQKLIFDKFITKQRLHKSKLGTRDITTEFSSDRSRVLYSPAFRRLQQKAQVFSLESNAAVRSRLTHSLEVSDVGRLIATKVAEKLINKNLLSEKYRLALINIVETACLIHDIGNPPFGHFGELAIQKWFSNPDRQLFDGNTNLINDFTQFDGNPQGIRIASVLQEPFRSKKVFDGFNLTLSQILCALKYVRCTSDDIGTGLNKKPGYFISEIDKITCIKESLGIRKDQRYPFTYLMEIADDIAYCLSDFEDAIEKGIISCELFIKELKREWKKTGFKEASFPANLKGDATQQDFFFSFKTSFTRNMIDAASKIFARRYNIFIEGTKSSLFDEDSKEHVALEKIKQIARKYIFSSKEAETKEIAGYRIITGLLNSFEELLKLSRNDFKHLVDVNNSKKQRKHLDMEWRIFNRLPKKYIRVYEYFVSRCKRCFDEKHFEKNWEMFCRIHLVLDYITGMTDKYALDTFQELEGMKIG
jgi:dGTPase